jgi:hypothetical protein
MVDDLRIELDSFNTNARIMHENQFMQTVVIYLFIGDSNAIPCLFISGANIADLHERLQRAFKRLKIRPNYYLTTENNKIIKDLIHNSFIKLHFKLLGGMIQESNNAIIIPEEHKKMLAEQGQKLVSMDNFIAADRIATGINDGNGEIKIKRKEKTKEEFDQLFAKSVAANAAKTSKNTIPGSSASDRIEALDKNNKKEPLLDKASEPSNAGIEVECLDNKPKFPFNKNDYTSLLADGETRININTTLPELLEINKKIDNEMLLKSNFNAEKYVHIDDVFHSKIPYAKYTHLKNNISTIPPINYANSLTKLDDKEYEPMDETILPRKPKWFQNNREVMISFAKDKRHLPGNIHPDMMQLFLADYYYKHYTVKSNFIADSKHAGSWFLSKDMELNVWRHAINADGSINHNVVELGARGSSIRAMYAEGVKHVYIYCGMISMDDIDSLGDNRNLFNSMFDIRDRFQIEHLSASNLNIDFLRHNGLTLATDDTIDGAIDNNQHELYRTGNMHDSIYYIDVLKYAVIMQKCGLLPNLVFSGHTFSKNFNQGVIRTEATWSRDSKTNIITMTSEDNVFAYQHPDMLVDLYENNGKIMRLNYTDAELIAIQELVKRLYTTGYDTDLAKIKQEFSNIPILFTVNKRFNFDTSDYIQGNIHVITKPVPPIQPSRNMVQYTDLSFASDLAKTNNTLYQLKFDPTKKLFYHDCKIYIVNTKAIDTENKIIYFSEIASNVVITQEQFQVLLAKYLRKLNLGFDVLIETAKDLVLQSTSTVQNVVHLTALLMDISSEMVLHMKSNFDHNTKVKVRNELSTYTYEKVFNSELFTLLSFIFHFFTLIIKHYGYISTSNFYLIFLITIFIPTLTVQYRIFKSQGLKIFSNFHISGMVFLVLGGFALDFLTYVYYGIGVKAKPFNIINTGYTTFDSYIFVIFELCLLIYIPKIFKPNNHILSIQQGLIKPHSHDTIYKTCVTGAHRKINNIRIDLKTNRLKIVKGYEWIMGIFSDFQTDKDFEKFCNAYCDCNKVEIAAHSMYTSLSSSVLKYYHNCIITLLTAIKRQLAKMPTPDKLLVDKIKLWFKKKYIKNILKKNQVDFNVSYNSWYNHLTYVKQCEIDTLISENHLILGKKNDVAKLLRECIKYTTFVKGELQFEGEDSKTRNICNVSTWRKLALGFLIWSIELYSRKHIKYYASGKSFHKKQIDRKKILEHLGSDVECLSLDFSAFDSTQHLWWKEAIDDQLYEWAVDNAKTNGADTPYFDFDSIKLVAQNHRAKIQVGRYIDGKFTEVCKINQNGTVHSGDPDTTLGNTWRTLVIFHYMLSKVLKLNENDYEIRSSGDDVDIYVRAIKFNKTDFVKAFKSFFLNKNTVKDEDLFSIFGTGMMMKMVNRYKGAYSESCSTHAYMSDLGDIIIIRQPHRFIKTLTYREKSNNQLTDNQYINAVAQCNLAWGHSTSGISTLLKKIISLTNNYTGFNVGKQRKTLEISDKERHFIESMKIEDDLENPHAGISSNIYKYKEKITTQLPKGQRRSSLRLASKKYLELYYDIDEEDIINFKLLVNKSQTIEELFSNIADTRFIKKMNKLDYIPDNLMKE